MSKHIGEVKDVEEMWHVLPLEAKETPELLLGVGVGQFDVEGSRVVSERLCVRRLKRKGREDTCGVSTRRGVAPIPPLFERLTSSSIAILLSMS